MKLNRTLMIANQTYRVIEENVTLALNQAGRAMFLIESGGESFSKRQAVAFEIGYAGHDQASQLFLGYVDSVAVLDASTTRLFCRELFNVLELPAPVSLRHPTLSDVLAELSQAVGLEFYTVETGKRIPHFFNLGDGYHALLSVGGLFGVADLIWQQLGNGVVYVGPWDQSRWADKPIELDPRYFGERLSNAASFAAIPTLRPGVVMNGERLKRVTFAGNSMSVEW